MVDAGPEKHNFDFWIHFDSLVMNFWHTDIKNLPAFMVYVPVSQELGPIFQVNPRDMRSY